MKGLIKKFKIVQESDSPVDNEGNRGYVLLSPDGEVWKVARPYEEEEADAFPPENWELEQVIEVNLRYAGPDTLAPNWKALGCRHHERVPADNPPAAVAKFWGPDVAQQNFPEVEIPPNGIFTTDKTPTGRFTANDFETVGNVSAAEKALFANGVACFVKSGFDIKFFTANFYRHLVYLFGFETNLDMDDFKAKYFSSAAGKYAFVKQIATGASEGVCADVERALSKWIKPKWLPYWKRLAEKSTG